MKKTAIMLGVSLFCVTGALARVQSVLTACTGGPGTRPDPACTGAPMACTSVAGNYVQARGGFSSGKDSGSTYEAECRVTTSCTDCTGGIWTFDDGYIAPGSYASGSACGTGTGTATP